MKKTIKYAVTLLSAALGASLQAAVTNVVGMLDLSADQTLDLADGLVTVVSNLTGGAHTLTVQGTGRLVVLRFSNPDARIEMASGTTLEARCAVPAVCAKAFFHVDACAVNTLTFSSENGTNLVSKWADVRGSGYPYAEKFTSVSTPWVHMPFITPGHYNGRDVMDFGSIWQSGHLQGWGGTLKWSSSASGNARPIEVFMAAGDTPEAKNGVDGTGGSHRNNALFGCSTSAATGVRGNGTAGGTSQLLLSGAPLASHAKMSFTVDGEARTATSYQLPDGMHVISCYATDSGYLDGTGTITATIDYFARERNNVFGGLRIGEYIVFTNLLSASERAEVNDYFNAKWRTEQSVASLSLAAGSGVVLPDGMNLVVSGTYENDGATITGPGRLTPTGSVNIPEFTLNGDETLDVPAGATYSIGVLKGAGGLLTKSGAGSLVVSLVKSANARFAVEEGAFTISPMVVPSCDDILDDACFHVDASVASSFVTTTVNGTNFVSRWNDVRGSGYPYAIKPNNANAPWIDVDETTGKPVVDFGTTWNNSTRTDGYGATLTWNEEIRRPMDMFIVERHNADMRQIVIDAAAEGQSGNVVYRNQALLGFAGSASAGFLPGEPASGHDSVAIIGYGSPLRGTANAQCRVDAGDEMSNAQARQYHPGYDQHVYGFYPTKNDYITGTSEIRFNAFANERGNVKGGQTLAEVAIFTNLLTAAQRDVVNTYLTMKWKPSVFENLTQADVAVVNGAVWDISWKNLIVTNSLTLGGTVNVKSLSAPATITLTEPSVVGGVLALPEGGVTITFAGDYWKDRNRSEPIKVLGVTSISGATSLVGRFASGQGGGVAPLKVGSDGVYLMPSGLSIFIR